MTMCYIIIIDTVERHSSALNLDRGYVISTLGFPFIENIWDALYVKIHAFNVFDRSRCANLSKENYATFEWTFDSSTRGKVFTKGYCLAAKTWLLKQIDTQVTTR